MQSTKDTKYIFNKSDKRPNRLCSKLIICLFLFFGVWNYLAMFIKSQLILISQIKIHQVVSYSMRQ